MGWTEVFDEPNRRNAWELLRDELYGSDSDRVLAHGAKGGTLYVAWRTDSGAVTCHVILYEIRKNSYCYKFMSESVGPFVYDVPVKVWNVLTPLDPKDSPYAYEWRLKVAEKRAAA